MEMCKSQRIVGTITHNLMRNTYHELCVNSRKLCVDSVIRATKIAKQSQNHYYYVHVTCHRRYHEVVAKSTTVSFPKETGRSYYYGENQVKFGFSY